MPNPPDTIYLRFGIEEDADESLIRQAWRRIALQYHPDRGGDENVFVQLRAWFEVLMKMRTAYDQWLARMRRPRHEPQAVRIVLDGPVVDYGFVDANMSGVLIYQSSWSTSTTTDSTNGAW